MISASPTPDADDVTIRPWASRDAPAVDALLAAIWGHDPQALSVFSEHGAARDDPGGLRRTLVAAADGRLVAVATVWESGCIRPAGAS